MAEGSSSLDSWRLQLDNSNRRFYQNLVESEREFYRDLNDLRISCGMPPVTHSCNPLVNQAYERALIVKVHNENSAMAEGTRLKPLDEIVKKVEAQVQQMQQLMASMSSARNFATESDQQCAKQRQSDDVPSLREDSEAPIQGIEEPDQEFKFKALPEPFTTAANLVLDDSAVKLVVENESKPVQIEESATLSRETVEEAKDLQIQFDSPKVILCSPGVVDKVASKEKGEFVGALTGQIEIVLPYMLNSADKNLKIPVEYQNFVDVRGQGRALLSEFSKALERIGVAYKVFDKMSNEDILSLSILSKNSNLEIVDFDPGGMCCWTWFIEFCIGCGAMATQSILARKLVFDPEIASFGMELGESKLFVEIPKGWVLQLTSFVEGRIITSEVLSDQLVCDAVTSVAYSDLRFIKNGHITFPFDRGRAIVEVQLVLAKNFIFNS